MVTLPVPSYDALLVLSFGGPNGPNDVMPFLENVVRGRRVPRERLLEVAENYYAFGGKSPINEQNLALISALKSEIDLPIYWGNRNWHPFLEDTLREMAAAGVKNALVFVTSAWSSYSACRQYREDIERARLAIGPGAPVCDKLRHFCLEDGFLDPMAENVRAALEEIGHDAELYFTAHSVPLTMAEGSRYLEQLREASRRVAARAGHPEHRLVFQSRSGPPHQPWLEPDVKDALTEAKPSKVVIAPIGFISDHMEVIVDLDTQTREHCEQLGIRMARARTVGTHPRFIRMIAELIDERRRLGPAADPCLENCCPH